MDPFRQSKHSLPWRSAFEFNAAIGWGLSVVSYTFMAGSSSLPVAPFAVAALLSTAFGVKRTAEAVSIWNLRINLLGKGMFVLPLQKYLDHCVERPKDLWLGLGFRWERHHTQRLYDYQRSDPQEVLPPAWYARLRGLVVEQQPQDSPGLPLIHGVGEKEEEIHLPFSLLEGNSAIFGTTGAGKTTLLRIIIAACIRRGDCVIVIDPKGDKTLVETMRETCRLTPGRERDFVYFHTAFAQQSVRYDILKNFDRVTSIASRISAQVPSSSGNDQFVAFAWRVILINSQLLVFAGERPTIARIRRNVEGGLESLLERCLVLHFESAAKDQWRADTAPLIDDAKDGKLAKPTRSTSDRLAAYVWYYQQVISKSSPAEALDAGINLYLHDRTHYSKMVSSLLPTLAMLDAGELGGLLSPRYDDIDDPREIFDSDRVVEGNKVIYFGLDSLSDSVVSGAVGSILVADLAAVAGARYNYEAATNKPRRITLVVDEAPEVVSAPFQQLASKGRGSGFTLWAASQTVPDYISRLGSEEKALSTLGNFNNLICLRIKDPETCDFVSTQFGKAFVDSRSYGLNTSTQSDSAATGFTGGEGVNVKDERMETVPPDILGKLPNHQYFALLAGGRLYKGRQPVVS